MLIGEIPDFGVVYRDAARFYAGLRLSADCWLWKRSLDKGGYGKFSIRRNGKQRHISASRYSYILHKGAVPSGLVVDHKCRVRHCVNPDHLRLLTNAENVLAGDGRTARQARSTHCIHGHPLSGDNLYIHKKVNGRYCKTCMKERRKINMRRYYAEGRSYTKHKPGIV